MGNRLMRIARACYNLQDQNPILSMHDQGAGGNGGVFKEIVSELYKASYDIRNILLGDETLTSLEIRVRSIRRITLYSSTPILKSYYSVEPIVRIVHFKSLKMSPQKRML